jgi:hypothetical protein
MADYQPKERALGTTLFESDQADMSDEKIAQILSQPLQLPASNRLIVVSFGPERQRYWLSEETTALDQAAVQGFLGKVRASDRISYASVLPSMLAPEQQNVPHLRKAAARCQGDLVFVYKTTSRIYQRQGLFSSEKARSYCVVEAVLLDTRTGLVPFTSSIVKSYTADRKSDDFTFAETVRKAELQAVGEALDEIADEMTTFLAEVPVGDPALAYRQRGDNYTAPPTSGSTRVPAGARYDTREEN